MKKLGFGLMRMPTIDKTNAADVDLEQVKRMVDLFMAKAALVDRYPRDTFTVATKLHAEFFYDR